jgi:hypothetical protein
VSAIARRRGSAVPSSVRRAPRGAGGRESAGAEPGERAQPLSLGRRAQLGQRRHAELEPDAPGGLGAEPGEVHEARDLLGDLCLALGQRVDLAITHRLDDLLLDRLADPVQLLGATVERETRDRRARLENAGRRLAVGADPERVPAAELDQVGEQLELGGERIVARERGVRARLRIHLNRSYAPISAKLALLVCAPRSACRPTMSSTTSSR